MKEIFYSSEVIAFDSARNDFSPDRDRCHIMGNLVKPERLCVLGTGTPSIAIWSDSHGVELGYALSKLSPVLMATYSGCPPAPGLTNSARIFRYEHNEIMLNYLENTPDIRTVIMAASYEGNIDLPSFRSGFSQAVSLLQANGKHVIIVGPIPTPGFNVPTALARGLDTTFPSYIFERSNADVLPWIEKLAGIQGASVIYPHEMFCDEVDCTLIDDINQPVLFDDIHLSVSGARLIANEVYSIIEK